MNAPPPGTLLATSTSMRVQEIAERDLQSCSSQRYVDGVLDP
jgi:hypothetical protein